MSPSIGYGIPRRILQEWDRKTYDVRAVIRISPFKRVSPPIAVTYPSLSDALQGTPPFCSAQQVNQYLESYVDHFNLRPHMRLNTAVKHIAREESNKWRLDFEFAPSEYYEKVVIATGPHHEPVMPTIQGARLFSGRIIHSKAFKRWVV